MPNKVLGYKTKYWVIKTRKHYCVSYPQISLNR